MQVKFEIKGEVENGCLTLNDEDVSNFFRELKRYSYEFENNDDISGSAFWWALQQDFKLVECEVGDFLKFEKEDKENYYFTRISCDYLYGFAVTVNKKRSLYDREKKTLRLPEYFAVEQHLEYKNG